MILKELERELLQKLNAGDFSSIDSSMNGVQVGDKKQEIKRVALMVDASLEGFKHAKKHNADLILTHHGLFWGSPIPVTDSHYARIKYLIENNLSLCSIHLPLDAHMELGNNIGIAKALNLNDCKPFGKYKGIDIGVKGVLESPKTLDQIKKDLLGENEPAYLIPGGKNIVSTIAIVSGGSPFSVNEAIDQDIDLFITGDKSHEVYHKCIEEEINMISAGHYATETYGVKSVGEWLEYQLGLETFFIDLPTGA